MDSVEELKKQHFLNYKNALIEIIKNNSDVLFDEDIKSLFKVPPLDSMDLLKVKIISLAKQENNVIENEQLEKILENYRSDIYTELDNYRDDRKKKFIDMVDSFVYDNNNIIKINKKDFVSFDKKLKRDLKECIIASFSKNVLKNVNLLFTKKENDFTDFLSQLEKYFNKIYLKQIMENFDFKILVKNTILINSVKEQGERYNFTLENSRLFD